MFTYQSGTRHGFECMCLDCDAGAVGFHHLSEAEAGAWSHSVNNWSKP